MVQDTHFFAVYLRQPQTKVDLNGKKLDTQTLDQSPRSFRSDSAKFVEEVSVWMEVPRIPSNSPFTKRDAIFDGDLECSLAQDASGLFGITCVYDFNVMVVNS